MKLTRAKLLETLRRKNEGWTTYQARKIAGISIRRVNQVWTTYRATGNVPLIGRRIGRPERPITEEERFLVCSTYKAYSVCAATLEGIILREYGKHIPHNHIHRIMVVCQLAKPKGKKDVRKKNWIRYERRHSLTAVHIDWYFDAAGRWWVFAVIDDASRKLLALIECDSPTTDQSIVGMEKALTHGTIRQCISGHDAQFVSNTGGESRFVAFLETKGIQHILCKIKHPQSNGKVERFFGLYKAKRHLFATMEEFVHWYNEVRPHRSLNFETLETPQEAFIRKQRAEV
jgi:putative transposase